MTPARKFSTRTSLERASLRTIAFASGFFRSSVTDFLPALNMAKVAASPSFFSTGSPGPWRTLSLRVLWQLQTPLTHAETLMRW